MIKSGLFAAAAVLLGAPGALAQETCEITGYTVLDHQHLVLQSGNAHWLATTSTRCAGLEFGAEIAFGEYDGTCPPAPEYITPPDGWRCAIDTIEPVDSVEHARELVQARTISGEMEAGEGELEDPNRD
ncbi:hypothetical protein E5163_00375 [Marinicauda algicola]|uniref:Uncharacterized protein n=2 Tax=Marinicauda algicola TaxID=2029849 RepID=A0A4S2H288_9PROT|nr:DUF6491 family protein [Marinicauda algicola]TGY89636.1 hypothetical protein E5163_00375 [Marinicauda algicola]